MIKPEFYTNAIRFKNKIRYRGYNASGDRVHRDYKYAPTLYVPSDQQTGYTSLMDGTSLVPKYFRSIWDASQFVEEQALIPGSKVCGSVDWVSCFLNETFDQNMIVDDSVVRILTIDIETNTEGGYAPVSNPWQPITAITVSTGKQFFSLGMKNYTPSELDVNYLKCANEADMLEKFLKLWRVMDTDIVTGWNSNGYDLPYIAGRVERVVGAGESSRLSPWDMPIEFHEVAGRFGMTTTRPSIPGISCVDYLDLYRNVKFVQTQREEYTLDYISEFELGEHKTPYQELGYPTLQDLYERNPQLYMDYNVQDVRLVVKIEKKLGFINLLMAIAYDARVNYADAVGSVKLWECIIHNKLLANKKLPPVRAKGAHGKKDHAIAGAYVKNPRPGVYRWVMSFDAASLYPSLIRMLNISPETFKGILYQINIVDLDHKSWNDALIAAVADNYSFASNGAAFDVKEGIIPELMSEYFFRKQKYGDDKTIAEKELERVEQELKLRS